MLEVAEWSRMKAAQIRQIVEHEGIVIVPIGSMEQHGPHLPVTTDSMLVHAVALRAASIVMEAKTRDQRDNALPNVCVTPVVWLGLSEHHMAFGGTLTADFTAFFAQIRCICRSLAEQGFRRICLLNGHGGNRTALDVVTTELTVELSLPLMGATYWDIADPGFHEILDVQDRILHACEAETSMMLALSPELVDMSCLDRAIGPLGSPLSDITGRAVSRWQSFRHQTASGVLGVTAVASAEKGERLLAAAAKGLAKLLLIDEVWNAPI